MIQLTLKRNRSSLDIWTCILNTKTEHVLVYTLPIFQVLICCSSSNSCSSLHPFSFSMRVLQSAGWRSARTCKQWGNTHTHTTSNTSNAQKFCILTASVGVFFNLLLSTFMVTNFYTRFLQKAHQIMRESNKKAQSNEQWIILIYMPLHDIQV